eukprot:TRINITY_DN7868_c0_g1_i1.p1 TRINITY_DN7868_c0_g1~~TRINITY_DN7868_c0_g1_i1.p1  ORF type:complete len:914 (+),score=255.86 TRINITY_DN7868_c0_g1_i1:76-2817(+)
MPRPLPGGDPAAEPDAAEALGTTPGDREPSPWGEYDGDALDAERAEAEWLRQGGVLPTDEAEGEEDESCGSEFSHSASSSFDITTQRFARRDLALPEEHRIDRSLPPLIGLRIDGMVISEDDYNTLLPGRFLNDRVINFFLALLEYRARGECCDKIAFLNTHLWARIVSNPRMAARWNARRSLLNCPWLFLPVNVNHHWLLVVVFNIRRWLQLHPSTQKLRRRAGGREQHKASAGRPAAAEAIELSDDSGDCLPSPVAGRAAAASAPSAAAPEKLQLGAGCPEADPVVLVFDSYSGQTAQRLQVKRFLQHHVAQYLSLRWQHELSGLGYDTADPTWGFDKLQRDMANRKRLRFIHAEVPQQRNNSDCGVFLLHFGDLLCHREMLDLLERRPAYWARHGLGSWFGVDPADVIGRKRPYLAQLLRWFREKQGESGRVSMDVAKGSLHAEPVMQAATLEAKSRVAALAAHHADRIDSWAEDSVASDRSEPVDIGDISEEERQRAAELESFKKLFREPPAPAKGAAAGEKRKGRASGRKRRRARRSPSSGSSGSESADSLCAPEPLRVPPPAPRQVTLPFAAPGCSSAAAKRPKKRRVKPAAPLAAPAPAPAPAPVPLQADAEESTDEETRAERAAQRAEQLERDKEKWGKIFKGNGAPKPTPKRARGSGGASGAKRKQGADPKAGGEQAGAPPQPKRPRRPRAAGAAGQGGKEEAAAAGAAKPRAARKEGSRVVTVSDGEAAAAGEEGSARPPKGADGAAQDEMTPGAAAAAGQAASAEEEPPPAPPRRPVRPGPPGRFVSRRGARTADPEAAPPAAPAAAAAPAPPAASRAEPPAAGSAEWRKAPRAAAAAGDRACKGPPPPGAGFRSAGQEASERAARQPAKKKDAVAVILSTSAPARSRSAAAPPTEGPAATR